MCVDLPWIIRTL